jgi:hypothetical protein
MMTWFWFGNLGHGLARGQRDWGCAPSVETGGTPGEFTPLQIFAAVVVRHCFVEELVMDWRMGDRKADVEVSDYETAFG